MGFLKDNYGALLFRFFMASDSLYIRLIGSEEMPKTIGMAV